MSLQTVRVGVIGAGGNTVSRHLPNLQAQEGVEIVGVCNRSRASSERVAQQFGIPKLYADWREAIADPETNAIVIGTWPYLHAPATLAALAADKHVLCEARMAMNAREARAMYEASRARSHLTAQIVPSPMTLPFDKTIRRLLAEGHLGEPLVVEMRVGGGFLDRDAPLHWRQDADLSGLNILSLGIWYEAVLRWVGEAARVTAMSKTFVKMRKDAEGLLRAVRVPEHVDVVADMVCGAQMHMQVSAVTGLAGGPEVFLFGSKGTLRLANETLFGGRRGDSQLQEIVVPEAEAGGWRVEEEFVNAIRGLEAVTHTTFAAGVKYMEFTEAVARSMAAGRAVSLPLSKEN